MFGVPAVAASLAEEATPRDYMAAAEEVLGVARRVKQYGITPGTFLNVNIPPTPAGDRQNMILSREAATAHSAKADCCRRFAAHDFFLFHLLRAYARSYVLPPLRG
jgi:broad specificity polyphosphatase/5'/3'-nucleotidase SurE